MGKNILFVCGGSGGHILPCVAMAEYFSTKNCQSYFLVSNKNVDMKIMENFSYPYATLHKISNKLDYCTFMYEHMLSVRTLLNYVKTDIVIASGSIYSFTSLLLLYIKKCRTFLFEPNVIPGRVNSLFFRLCEKVFTGWRSDYSADYFGAKVCISGIPIRESIRNRYNRYEVLSALNLSPDKKTILILGGSQGSKFLNNYVVRLLLQSDISDKINIILLTSDKFPEEKFKKDKNIKILPFTIEVGKYYDATDLVITRSGAITLAEICYKQIPNISIPYPSSANNHQIENSKFLQKEGVTFLMEEGGFCDEHFIGLCKKLLFNDNLIGNLRAKMKGYFIDNAQEKIFKQIMNNEY